MKKLLFLIVILTALLGWRVYRLETMLSDYAHVERDAICSAHPGQFGCGEKK